MIKKLIMAIGIIIMISVGYSFIDDQEVQTNSTILEYQPNITVTVTVDTPDPFWGQECMDCHQNPHDPMQGVPSETVFDGHKNLDCVFCHADYDNPQKCISCHEGHNIFHRE